MLVKEADLVTNFEILAYLCFRRLLRARSWNRLCIAQRSLADRTEDEASGPRLGRRSHASRAG